MSESCSLQLGVWSAVTSVSAFSIDVLVLAQ